jgi:hypothetical protein
MKTELFEKSKKWMTEAFTRVGQVHGPTHHERAVHWVKQLDPAASEALLIAAVTHDIERAFNGDWKAGSSDPDKLRKHQDLSAKEVGGFLQRQGADKDLIERVKELVSRHDEGGDDEQNTLCSADALTYFDHSALRHAKKCDGVCVTKQQMIDKFDYVWTKLKTDKAKVLAKPMYDKAVESLTHLSAHSHS